MAKAFSTWIGARTRPDYDWPPDLMSLYEACRAAYDIQGLIEQAARLLPKGGITGQLLGECDYDAMAVWQCLERIAQPHFTAWERRTRNLDLMRVFPRTVPVLARHE